MNRLVVLLLFILCNNFLFAQEEDPFSLSLEELMKTPVVTSGKAGEKASEIPASVVVITREEIELYGYTNLTDILRNIVGLYLVEQYNWSGMTGLGVRGYFTEGSFSNFKILVNGSHVLREGYINQYIISRIAVPVEAIERIEIIRGPMSVMFGENAFFGVVNIITLEEYENQSNNLTTFHLGSNKAVGAAVRSEVRKNDFSGVINLASSQRRGLDVPFTSLTSNPVDSITGLSYLERIGLNNTARTGDHLDEKTIYANIAGSFNGLKFSVGHTYTNKGFFWQSPSHHPDGNTLRIMGTDLEVQYQHQLSSNLLLTGKMAYSDYNSLSRYRLRGDDFFGFSHIYSTILNANVDALITVRKNIKFQVGLFYDGMPFSGDDVDIPSFTNVENSSWRLKDGDFIHKYHAYTQLKWKPIERLSLIAGSRAIKFGSYTYQRLYNQGLPDFELRERRFHDVNVYFTYNVATLFHFSEKHIFKLLFGTAFTTPSIRQHATHLDEAESDINLLPTLQPSFIRTTELQYNGLFSDKIVFKLATFLNRLDDLIESLGVNMPDGRYVVVTQNSGELRTLGLEGIIRYRLMDNLELSASASWQVTENMNPDFEGVEQPYSPNLLLYFKGIYRLPYNVKAAANVMHVGSMKTSLDVNADDMIRVGPDAPAYWLMDCNIRIDKILHTGLFASLHVSNVLNSEVRFAIDPANRWADKGFLGMPREFCLKLGYTF